MAAITAAIAAIGLGVSAFGAYEKYDAAKQTAQSQENIAGLETQQDAVRRQAMEIQARRQQLEVLRVQQRTRSVAESNATNQGAQLGSGLQGGYGQISGMTGNNLTGIRENLAAGENMFDLNAQISQQRIQIARSSSESAFGTGLMTLGGGILSSASAAGRLGQGFGSTSIPQPYMNNPAYGNTGGYY